MFNIVIPIPIHANIEYLQVSELNRDQKFYSGFRIVLESEES